MSASSVLLVVATVIAAQGDMAIIDIGKDQLLEAGDAGQVYYELVVNGVSKRIDAGAFEVARVSDSTTSIAAEPDTKLRVGYQVELRLPISRQLERLKSLVIDKPSPPPPVPPAPEPDVVADREPTSPELEKVPVSKPLGELPAVPARPEPPDPRREENIELTLSPVPVEPEPMAGEPELPAAARDVLEISPGRYAIGLHPSEAQFFNQTPRHMVLLEGYEIDRHPVAEGSEPAPYPTPQTGLSFDESQARCLGFGLRLPTEQEWEVAAQAPGFVARPGLFEWTASWYVAYPGNLRSEEEYGDTHRVLRGSPDGSPDSLFTRQFMSPQQGNPKVGFRCVADSS